MSTYLCTYLSISVVYLCMYASLSINICHLSIYLHHLSIYLSSIIHLSIYLSTVYLSLFSRCPVQLFVTPMDCSTPGFPVLHCLLEHISVSIESVMPLNHLILSRPVFLLLSIFSSIRVFSNESALHTRQPKYWSFTFSIRPSSEYSGLISFSIDWFDLLAVQGTLKNLLQHQSSKASVL